MDDFLFTEAELDLERRPSAEEVEKDEVKPQKEVYKQFEKKLFIVDGYSLIYRSYYAFLSRPLKDRNGENISAYFGFFNTLFSLFKNYSFDYFIVAMDSKAKTFRSEMYPEYKANRAAAPEDLHAQVPKIIDTLGQMNIPYMAKDGYEADDLIATLCKNATRLEVDSVMVTGDKDLLQLVDDHVFALRPVKNEKDRYELFNKDDVFKNFGVRPEQIIDYLSILGDSSDNVPGVKGIGEKGAVKLLEEYVTLDGIYRNLDFLSPSVKRKLEDGRESAYFSKKLIELKSDIFTLDTFDDDVYKISTIDYEKGVVEFENANCRSLAKQASLFSKGEAVLERKALNKTETSPLIAVDENLKGLGDYVCITDLDELSSLLSYARDNNLPLAFDTETTSLDYFDAQLVGFSFSYEAKKAYYVPLVSNGKAVLGLDPVIGVLKSYLEGGLRIIGQNIKYDMRILSKYGIKLENIIFDTMVAAWLIDSNLGIYNMDFLADRYLDYETIAYEQVVGKGENFSDLDLETQTRYAAEDADITYRLYCIFSKQLVNLKLDKLYSGIENPLIYVLSEMEDNGILLDLERLDEIGENIKEECERLAASIFSLAGEVFNLNSSQQLSKILFEKRKLTPGKKTQTGYSTDTQTLEDLVSSGDEIIPLILKYRTYSKLQSTYVDSLLSLVGKDGRLHTQFLQTGTATGRLSSRNPNLQNIPIRTEEGRLIRTAFVPKPGYQFLSADYSQIELVVLAHLSSDSGLKKAFISGLDVHAHTASLIFNKSIESITSDERRMAKTINFGIIYGMSAFRLANSLSISRAEAKDFMDRYFNRYVNVKAFIEKTIKQAEENGFVQTLYSHRRDVDGIRSKNKNDKAAAERIAVNTVIQGTAAEIMKKAMINIHSKLKKGGYLSKILLQVHDELILEVKEEEKDSVYELVKFEMENVISLSIPLKASLEFGHNWGEMH